ncbi:creatininase family protein [Paeniglutamicibacter psychrophenolicus]|uniref:creatininase family protein n=1 Tax=Paeniglutamicibacter psychrophenolicus TaxID=257454 RepID=UPI002784D306|nr:creatininase family protein [Paeniglutamicibacter psychrophenolicus]MDQ0092233.1 creatinine amidohydrolase [Paeniglutamicibacter psychrophenolicus]
MSHPKTVQVELLSPAELDACLAAAAVAYLPLGTLEFHGPHLPIGLDALTAHGVCLAAARLGGGIVLPTVYQGFGGGHGHYPWTIMMENGEGIAAHLTATLSRLEDFGVRTAVIFSGHFADEQLQVIDDVAAAFNQHAGGSLRVLASAVNRCPTASLQADHAGEFETTLLGAIAPGLVHLDRLPPVDTYPAADPGGDSQGVHRHDKSHPLWGVFGPDPRLADLSRSPELLADLAAWLVRSVDDQSQGTAGIGVQAGE